MTKTIISLALASALAFSMGGEPQHRYGEPIVSISGSAGILPSTIT